MFVLGCQQQERGGKVERVAALALDQRHRSFASSNRTMGFALHHSRPHRRRCIRTLLRATSNTHAVRRWCSCSRDVQAS